MAAQRILAKIFGRYFVQFKAVPLSRYSVLQRLFEREAEREMSWVLLNCGGSEDVTQWMHPENHKVYIVDNHRPLHLHNIESEKVFIFDDGSTQDEYLHKMTDKSSKSQRKRRRHNDEDDVPLPESDADSTSDSEEDASRAVDGGRKRKHMPKEAERDYYRGSYYGLSAAATLYMLADQLHVSNDPEVLWMAILGITEQFLFRKIPKDLYREQIHLFQESVHARLLQKPINVTFGDGFTAPKFNESKIVADDEYRFVLLRHWSLYESMWHSQFVAGRLGLYTSEKGKLLLDTLLSKVGISPQLRKSAFSAIPEADQKSLKDKLLDYGRVYGLRDFTFRSFFKHQGYGFALSAADLVYGVSALLEQPAETEQEFRKHFWKAYETLQSDDAQTIKEGIELAKAQQAALVRQATVMLAKSCLINCGAFRLGYLGDSTDAMDLDCLRRPGILQRMARFLSEIRTCQPATRTAQPPVDKPLVLAAKNLSTNTWTVVGVQRDKGDGTVERNKFSNTFRLAALKSRANCATDGVDPAAIEVHQDSLRQFMDAVLYHINTDA
eukprot:GGOE01021146.1.p1 GENE.GGOE01021146.1~~GGOE01021146.1.p1  ORF type:complete len:594 (+),score=194.43 GGOE01021146.1:123-1784(+)